MKLAHTPGPWQLIGSRIFSSGNDRVRVELAQTKPDGAFGMGPIQEANARLITAAPELLAACALLLNTASAHGAGETDFGRWHACKAYEIGAVLNEARAAIAKAKGESC